MFELLLLSAIIISVFLSLVLLRKAEKSVSECILLFWLLSTGYLTLSYYLVYTKAYEQYPSLTVSGFCLPLVQGPFMYLYIKYQTRPLFFQKRDLLHLLPFFVVSILFVDFYFLPFEERVQVLLSNAKGYEVEGAVKTFATYISGVVYIFWSYVALYKFKKTLKSEFSNTEKINFNWMFYLNLGLSVIWIIVLFVQDDRLIFGSGAVYILCFGYFGLTQINVFSEKQIRFNQSLPVIQEEEINPDSKDSNAVVSKNENTTILNVNLEKVYIGAIAVLEAEKLYLNPELKLIDLAIKLNVHPNTLSKAINEVSGNSFYELINKKRVEEFIRRLESDHGQKYTLIALANDSGFNSKATFNRNFKLITGQSPSEYSNKLRNRSS